MVCIMFFFFFFSSRRRHTRSLRDWSSDVCSSDLTIFPDAQGGLRRLETASHGVASAPVGAITLEDDIRSCIDQIKEITGDSEALNFLVEAYAPGETFASAFAKLMTRLFSHHGLVLLEPSDVDIYRIASPLLQKAGAETDSLVGALLEHTKEIEAAGHEAQVKVTPSSTLLFFFKDGARVPIHK